MQRQQSRRGEAVGSVQQQVRVMRRRASTKLTAMHTSRHGRWRPPHIRSTVSRLHTLARRRTHDAKRSRRTVLWKRKEAFGGALAKMTCSWSDVVHFGVRGASEDVIVVDEKRVWKTCSVQRASEGKVVRPWSGHGQPRAVESLGRRS